MIRNLDELIIVTIIMFIIGEIFWIMQVYSFTKLLFEKKKVTIQDIAELIMVTSILAFNSLVLISWCYQHILINK